MKKTIQGIYIIKNKVNDKVYVGQSVDINRRWYQHCYSAENESANDHNSKLHYAMKKLGKSNFYYEILEVVKPKELLNDREIYWIDYYNSFKNGYNGSIGGDLYGKCSEGSSNGRAKLVEEDVINIRRLYNQHIPFREVYNLYKSRIGKRGFQHIWYYENWKNILPEYNTDENKKWHSTKTKANSYEIAVNNKRAFTDEEVREIRSRYDNGESVQHIWKSSYPMHAKSIVYNVVKRITYKDID